MNNMRQQTVNNNLHSVISCDYEGCKWIGSRGHLSSHKDRECRFAVDYLRDKCSSLALKVQKLEQQLEAKDVDNKILKQQLEQQPTLYISTISNNDAVNNLNMIGPICYNYQSLTQQTEPIQSKPIEYEYYHTGTVTNYHPSSTAAPTTTYHPEQFKKIHTGFKIYENNEEIIYRHIWIENHFGKKIDAGTHPNGHKLYQWSCCDNIWDNNTANGCEKICKICKIKYYKDKDHNHGCKKKKEIVQYIKWSCCNQKETMSEYGTKACTSVYKCCGRNVGDNGCSVKKDESKATYLCCGASVISYQNNYSSGCQTKWTCCNKPYYDNNGYISVGCNYRQKNNNDKVNNNDNTLSYDTNTIC